MATPTPVFLFLILLSPRPYGEGFLSSYSHVNVYDVGVVRANALGRLAAETKGADVYVWPMTPQMDRNG